MINDGIMQTQDSTTAAVSSLCNAMSLRTDSTVATSLATLADDLQSYTHATIKRARTLVSEAESIIANLDVEETSLRALLKDLDKAREGAEQALIDKERQAESERNGEPASLAGTWMRQLSNTLFIPDIATVESQVATQKSRVVRSRQDRYSRYPLLLDTLQMVMTKILIVNISSYSHN